MVLDQRAREMLAAAGERIGLTDAERVQFVADIEARLAALDDGKSRVVITGEETARVAIF